MLMKFKSRLFKEEDGNVLILFSLLMIIIMGMAGLVIDIGFLYSTRSHLKKTANAAALSGAQELTNDNNAVTDVVLEILRAHKEEESLKEVNIETSTQYKLNVVLEKDVTLKFLKLFKINSMTVRASSSAGLISMGRASGAVPLGIDENIPLEYFKEYSLKVDSGDSDHGYFGILALSGVGAKLYEQDLMYGYDGEIEVGDIISTQTGNIAGKTRDSINYRINSCNHIIDDLSYRDCERIILVLVYKPHNFNSKQLKEVEITGFAYFYIKSPMGHNDSSINGYFIKRTGSGFGDENVVDTGAYAIRLIE